MSTCITKYIKHLKLSQLFTEGKSSSSETSSSTSVKLTQADAVDLALDYMVDKIIYHV